MARNGSGTYSLPAGNPVVTGTTISSTWANNTLSDIATALTNSIAKDGQTTPTANMPMGNFKLTGLGSGSAATDSANLGQIQEQAYIYLGSVAGADTITASTTPVTTSYVAGQTYRFVAAGSNTGAATLNINSLGAKSITKSGSSALVSGDIVSGALYQVTYDGTRFQLLNPGVNVGTDAVTASALADSALGFAMINGTLTASVAANALTVAVKTKAGTDPTATDPVLIVFRNATLTDGTYSVVSVTAATSMTVPAGAAYSLGTVNGVAANLVILLINNSGTAELAIINLAGGNQLDETNLITTTSIGGGNNSSSQASSTVGRTNVPYRVVGIIDITEATAGTWASAPTKVTLVGSGQALAMSSLGFGQTWQDLTASRSIGTTYYNTTGRPIFVMVSAAIGSAINNVWAVTVNGVNLGRGIQAYGANASQGNWFLVPAGASYVVSNASGSTTPSIWAELR